jgi:hypothetical protein
VLVGGALLSSREKKFLNSACCWLTSFCVGFCGALPNQRDLEQGPRSRLSLQLAPKLGQLPDALGDRITALAPEQRSAIAILSFSAIDNLSNGLEAQG